MKYLWLLIVVAIAGNYAVRKIMRRIDRHAGSSVKAQIDVDILASVSLEEVLQSWGRLSPDPHFQPAGPLHQSILNYLQRYEVIAPNKYLVVLRRDLATQPFKENIAFVQIGIWFDGSEVLARRDVSDQRIYLANIEGDVRYPDVVRDTFEHYAQYVWLLDHPTADSRHNVTAT